MHAGLARAVASALFAVGLLFGALYLFANKPAGTFGLATSLLAGQRMASVDRVEPHGAAARAGLRVGDTIEPVGESLADRAGLYLIANPPLLAVGDRFAVRSHRGAAGESIALIADRDPENPRLEAAFFCLLAFPILALGWLIVWRKAESSDARTLGFMLLSVGLWIATPDRIGTPLARLVLYEIVSSTCTIVGVLLATSFFARYPEGQGTRESVARRRLLTLAYVVSIIEFLLMVATYAAPAFIGATPLLVVPAFVVTIVPPLAAFACLLIAFARGDENDRMRLRWLGTSFFVGFSGPLLLPTLSLLLGSQFTILDQVLLESTLFVLAFGMTYAILRRRVVDMAFVLNRALVFSVVSAVVVAVFIGIEWFIGAFFVNLSRPTSFLVEVGAAVTIGFSLRPLHAFIDRIIDRVFFARRHQAEKALRHLATEIPFVRDRDALLARVCRDIAEHLDARFVSIYSRDDTRSDFLLAHATKPGAEFIDADDDAVVALAAREAPVELHKTRTHISGELALPLAVRKTLIGILVLGEKPAGEAFAPDEIESLRFLAGYLGTALAASPRDLSPGQSDDSVLGAILNELRLQREDLRAITEVLRQTRN